jgi:hypothetical protein
MRELMQPGTPVDYYDEHAQRHDALVTIDWGSQETAGSINLVFVSSDKTKEDSYGRQIERATSVVHKNQQSAPGNYWSEKEK